MTILVAFLFNCPNWHGVALSLLLIRSTFQATTWKLPQVTSCKSSLFKNFTLLAVSFAAGVPQIACPLSTSQITRELSSCPPKLAKYLSLGEKHRQPTITLCRE